MERQDFTDLELVELYEKSPHDNRRSGRSTRLVDEIIQDLFEGQEVMVVDHYNTKRASKMLAKRVVERLEREHNQKCHIETRGDYPLLKLK